MYKEILVPVDQGIMTNDTCIKEAQKIVADGGRIHCIFVHRDSVEKSLPEDEQIDDTPIERAEEQLSKTGVNFVTRSMTGNPAEEIARYANENPIDVIVMNTHNRSGIRRLLAGSVTEDTIDKANCPVLVLTETDN